MDEKLDSNSQPSPAGQGNVRAQFEAWARSEFLSVHRHGDSGPYSHPRTFSAWEAWQAALAARQPVGQEPVIFDSVESIRDYVQKRLPVGMTFAIGPVGVSSLAGVVIAPPAQAVDLGQFREAVSAWWSECSRKRMNSIGGPAHIQESAKLALKEADRLLALIDSQA